MPGSIAVANTSAPATSMLPAPASPTSNLTALVAAGSMPASVTSSDDLNVQSQYQLLMSYLGPQGVRINSYSSQWDTQEKLKELYLELLANFHGEEIAYLSTVNIFPDYPYGEGVAGLYHGKYTWTGLKGNRAYSKGRSIDLTGGDTCTTVDQLAKTLAHEYGHHFTMYYLWIKEGKSFDNWQETRWAKVRGLINLPQVGKQDAHEWSPEEIAAEDYVQLFGSAVARQSADFQSQYGTFSSSIYNLSPQENLELPFAAQVAGLEEYWRSLAGFSTKNLNLAPLAPTLALTEVQEGYGKLKRLVFGWTKGLDDRPGPLEYTLIYYKKGDTLAYPVATAQDNYLATFVADGKQGTRLFRVLAKDQSGKLSSSNILTVDTADPVTSELPEELLFRDVSRGYWAFRPIQDLALANYLTGHPDNTFRPEQPVTRAEFVALLVRIMGWQETEATDQASPATAANKPFADMKGHWATELITLAHNQGIVNGDQANNFKPEAKVSRAEMAAILTRVLALKQLSTTTATAVEFKDINHHWAKNDITTATQAGLLTGQPNGYFQPDLTVKRSELAIVLERLLNLKG